MSRKQKTAAARIAVLYIPLFIVLALVLIPFLWAVSTSFKTIPEFQSETLHYLPQSLNFDNYSYVWGKSGFSTYFVNSVIVSSLSVVVVILLCICNAYALSRYKFRGKSGMTLLLLGTQMMPVILYLVPLFSVFKTIKLIDSPAALVIFNIILQTPFNTLLMRSFVNGVPKELDEAAEIDGATDFQIFTRIMLPAIRPILIVIFLFSFTGAWNDFLWPLIAISDESKYTLTLGMNRLKGMFIQDPRLIAAGALVSLIPIIVFFCCFQRYFFRGLEQGGLKG